MRRLRVLKSRMEAAPDGQVSLIDQDARSMASQGKGTGIVGHNVQTAVDTKNHLIVTHEVTNVGSDGDLQVLVLSLSELRFKIQMHNQQIPAHRPMGT
jgi:hypothetical protein